MWLTNADIIGESERHGQHVVWRNLLKRAVWVVDGKNIHEIIHRIEEDIHDYDSIRYINKEVETSCDVYGDIEHIILIYDDKNEEEKLEKGYN